MAINAMNRRQVLAMIPLALALPRLVRAEGLKIAVTKDPTCGCCENWVKHLKDNGFQATVTESSDMDAVKNSHNIPKAARSCHTGIVDGYVIEGHVPAADIKRVLKDRPAVIGLAVPGMPVGSPGMESSTGRLQPFDVLTFDKMGRTSVFASYGR